MMALVLPVTSTVLEVFLSFTFMTVEPALIPFTVAVPLA